MFNVDVIQILDFYGINRLGLFIGSHESIKILYDHVPMARIYCQNWIVEASNFYVAILRIQNSNILLYLKLAKQKIGIRHNFSPA